MRYLILLIAVISCYSSKIVQPKVTITGDWCLVNTSIYNEINYEKITLTDNSRITLYSRADTIYSYQYKVDKDSLLIFKTSTDTSKVQILKLTPDSLILSSLLEKKNIQRYYKCRGKVGNVPH